MLQIEPLLDRKPRQLSGGQRQRVAIGRAIVRDPKVFLFDEPLSNLDAALRVQTRIEIAKLHSDMRATMIYVTHDQVEAMTLADRIVVLNAGRIEQVGTPLELYHRPANLFVAGFIGSPQMNFIESRGRRRRSGRGAAAPSRRRSVSRRSGPASGVGRRDHHARHPPRPRLDQPRRPPEGPGRAGGGTWGERLLYVDTGQGRRLTVREPGDATARRQARHCEPRPCPRVLPPVQKHWGSFAVQTWKHRPGSLLLPTWPAAPPDLDAGRLPLYWLYSGRLDEEAAPMISKDDELVAFVEGLGARVRLMGVDLGTKTIGLALSDVEKRIATPLETLKRVKFTPDAERMKALCDATRRAGSSSACP